jgi:large subunit ribosomal protein L9
MKILLLKFVLKVGNQGDIVDVSDGYAKNALIAKKIAIAATPTHIREWEQKKQKQLNQKQERQKAIKELLPLLQRKIFEFSVKTGDGGAVFTSVHQDDIQKKLVDFLRAQNKLFETDDVHLEVKPIKELGEQTIQIRLGRGEEITKTNITINIIGA